VYERLLGRGILVRAGATVGLPGYIRVTMAPAPLMRAATREIVAALDPA
jgi:histidinol-phosphate/aromatic aminotransferase/cobyric acid decarboxylase-like protein